MSKIICVLALVLALPVAAKDSAPVSASESHVSTTKEKDIHRLLVASGAAARGAQVFHLVLEGMKQNHPDVPDRFWTEMEKEFKGDGLVELMVPIYDRHFTDAEIKQLIAFYQSPIGKKLLQEQPAIVRESMQAGRQYGLRIAQTVLAKLATFKK